MQTCAINWVPAAIVLLTASSSVHASLQDQSSTSDVSVVASETSLAPVTVTASPDEYRSSETSTAMRTETPLLQTPQSVQVVPRAVIEDQNALTLSEAVRNVAGVQYDFGFNGSMQPLLILRGFSNTSMTALGPMSGISSYYLNGSRVSGVPINMANVQSVEVVKGPASVLYGRAEPGGLVNVVTKPTSGVREFSVEQTVGQYSLSRTAVEAGGSLNEDRSLRARIAASRYRTESIRDFVEDRLGAFTGTLAWTPSSAHSIVATVDYSDNRYRTDMGVPAINGRPADLPWSRQLNDSPYLSSARTTALTLEGSHQFNDHWRIKGRWLALRSSTSEMDISPYRVDYGLGQSTDQTCPGTGDPLCRYYFGVRPNGRYLVDQFNVDVIGNIDAGAFKHTILAGIDFYRTSKRGTTYMQQIGSASPYLPMLGNKPGLDLLRAVPQDYDDRSRWTGFYLQDQIAIGSGWFLSAAIRHEATSAIFASPGTAPNKRSFTTPRIGAVWQLSPTQSVYAQYQEAVGANNGRDTQSGAALEVERARQWEVGHKVELLNGKLSSTLAVFHLTKRNRGASVPIEQPPFYNTVTVGEARSRGIEWDVSGQLARKLLVIGSYAYTDTDVMSDPMHSGKKIANVARHAASLWARYSVDSHLSVGAGVFAQGRRYGDVGNTFTLPGYGRIDAMANYRFAMGASSVTLQLNIDNVFNRKYFVGSHQFVQDWIKLAPPRTGKITVRLDH